MKNKIREFFLYIGQLENIITIVGGLVAGVIAYFGIINNNIQQTLTALLTILGALAIAQILAGYENSKIRRGLEKLIISSTSFLSSRKKLDADEPFEQFLAQGHDIVIMGASLVGTILNNFVTWCLGGSYQKRMRR